MRVPKSSLLGTATDVPAATYAVNQFADDAGNPLAEDTAVEDLDTFEGRLRWLLTQDPKRKLSGREAARRLGMPGETINGLLRKRTRPSFEVLETLHRKTGVNLNWLVCKNGGPHDGAPAGHIQWPSAAEEMKSRTKRRRQVGVPSGTQRVPKR